jgi:hypothetical protein
LPCEALTKISFDDFPSCDLASSNLLLSGMGQIVISATCKNMLIWAAPFDVVFDCTCNGWQGFCHYDIFIKIMKTW